MDDVAIMAAETNRSRIYLQALEMRGLIPSAALLAKETSNKGNAKSKPPPQNEFHRDETTFNLSLSVEKLASRMNIPIKHSHCSDPNSEETISIIKTLKQSFIIYSGPAGVILKQRVLNLGKKFLHIHPGIVPKFRGSTTIYYSLLKEGTVGASAFFMDQKIDQGPIIRQDTFPNFENKVAIDCFEDSFMRAQLLVNVLNDYAKSGSFEIREQVQSEEEETYFIIHPILKSIAIFGTKN